MVIEAVVKKNPLSNCGNIITGQRFIGREDEIETIQNRILNKNGGNIAIMGLPRVGKSSLAWKSLMEQRDNALKDKIFIIRINVGDISTSKEFYQTLINDFSNELEEEDFLDDKKISLITKHKNIIFNPDENTINIKNSIGRFYRIIAKSEVSVIYILDEFDHIGTIFKLEDFQFLRELSINPDIKIAFMTISRRTIQEIELLGNVALSKLSTIFSDLNLGLFDDNEIDLYWKRLNEFGIKTDKEYQDRVKYYTGNHPFLIDIFNSEIINELLIKKEIDIEESINKLIRLTFFNLYDNIITLLREEKLYDKLIQILFGPRYDLDSKSIERLLKFGMIYKDENSRYQCFLNFFKEYLSLKQNEIDFWPLWSETEISLRTIIKQELFKKYGEEWEEEFIKKYPKKENSIIELRRTMEKNKRNFPDKASSHLVDYTYPKDMYDIFISTDWSTVYCHIFNGQKKDWIKKFKILAKIRNPIAHNNEYFLNDVDKNLAISYCKEINNILKNKEE
jgi:hypothetical protein